jgi:hypothetical protein
MLERVIRRSRVRLGNNRFAGLPAVFAGVAVIVAAAGVTAAMSQAVTALPVLVRETRELYLSVTAGRRRLEP